MNSSSVPGSERVLDDLGAEFVHAFIDAVDGARDDFTEFKKWKPGWFAGFTGRFTANFLHERIWDRLVRGTHDMESIHVKDREPVREISVGTTYRIRIKRHHPGDRISAYGTKESNAFWSGTGVTLDGLESFSLALGYYWDADLRTVGDAILSFRISRDSPIWAVNLRRDTGTTTGFTWTPIVPGLPEIDLSSVLREAEEESGS